MAKEKTTLTNDVKTVWVGGCKSVVDWLSSFGKPKTNPALEKEMMMMKKAVTKKPRRARGKKGKFKADIKETKDYNEAWVGGKAPKKRKKK